MRLLDRDTCRDLDQLNFQDWVSLLGSSRVGYAQALLTCVLLLVLLRSPIEGFGEPYKYVQKCFITTTSHAHLPHP